jgi:hypothetical protein
MDLNALASSLFSESTAAIMTLPQFVICTVSSVLIGLVIGLIYMYRQPYSRDFVVTLALLPAMVQLVIMLVNGNMGVGVAVLGAFSLVRFRSLPGSARDIAAIFMSMAAGLACGMGYIGLALVFVLIMAVANVLLVRLGWGRQKTGEQQLKVAIPETLDFTDVFDDVFATYTDAHELEQVKTTNMGALYQLCYRVHLKPGVDVRAFIDELRCRNGNLEVALGRDLFGKNVL